MSRHYHESQHDLGTLVRGLAHDAYHALRLTRRVNPDQAGRLIPRVDRLMGDLNDRVSTDLYQWLESLRCELVRATLPRPHRCLLDDEGSGFHDTPMSVPVGS